MSLRTVDIDGHVAHAQAVSILRVCHGLRCLTVYLRGTKVDVVRRQVEELCELGVRCGLRCLRVIPKEVSYADVRASVPAAAKAGWLQYP